MSDSPGGLILSILGPFFFYGGLIVIIVMMRKLSKEVADLKRAVLDLQETVIMESRPPVHGPVASE